MFQKNKLDFFSIGGQVNNSSSQNEFSIIRAMKIIQRFGMNSVAFPVYWSRLEPQEDHFNFEQVDFIIDQANTFNVKLILLWFGSWKNGTSHYIPAWMKRDHARFPRVLDSVGNECMVLSPHFEESLRADQRAFDALLSHVKEYDQGHRIIAVQVENEPGIHASPRDYSETANLLFENDVPNEVREFVFSEKEMGITAIWRKAGAVNNGNWRDFFGHDAEELFSAFYFATYINRIAQSGKKIYDIPLYINVWVKETQNRIPGIDFPCGGATSTAIGIWKQFAPSIDCICPDLYFNDRETYMHECSVYSREDNPLYIPESHADGVNSLRIFEAIGKYDLTGIQVFAIDATVQENGELTEAGETYKRTVNILTSMKPLLEKYYKTGRIYSVVQHEFADSLYLEFEDYFGRVLFFDKIDEPYVHLDNLHEDRKYLTYRGKGLIVDAGGGMFYLAGEGFKLMLIPKKDGTHLSTAMFGIRNLSANNCPFISVEEGYMDEMGIFMAVRERTGDEDDNGLWVTSDIGLVRAIVDKG